MGMHLLAFPAEIFGREFWALFKIFRYLYPFEKMISCSSKGKNVPEHTFERSGAVDIALSQNTVCLSADMV